MWKTPVSPQETPAPTDGEREQQIEQGGRVLAGAGAVLAGLAGAYLLARGRTRVRSDYLDQ